MEERWLESQWRLQPPCFVFYGAAWLTSQQGLQHLSNPLFRRPSNHKIALFMAGLQLVLLSDVWLEMRNNGNERSADVIGSCPPTCRSFSRRNKWPNLPPELLVLHKHLHLFGGVELP